MADKTPSISLTIQLPDGSTKVLEFNTADPIMVGSGASSHVKLSGDDVSSLHCMLKPRDGKVYVLDLGSDEGTEHNGKELKGETALEDGDIVTVGHNKLTVHFGGDVLAPTVPIRRAAGHAAAIDESTIPLKEMPLPSEDGASALKGGKKSEEPTKVETKKPETKKPEPAKVEAKVEAKKPEPKVEAKKPEPKAPAAEPKAAAAKTADAPEAKVKDEPKKSSSKNDATEVVRERNVSRKATDMPPRTQHREASQSGFKLGKSSDHHAHRTIEDTEGKAAALSPVLSDEFKSTDKRTVDVTAMWGGTVIAVARAAVGQAVTIGDSEGARIRLSHQSIPSPIYPLVTVGAQGAVVNPASGMEVLVDGKPASGQVTLENGQKVTVRVGPVELVIQYSKKSPLAWMAFSELIDVFYTKILALALIIQMGLIIALLITPVLPSLDDEDLFKNNSEFTKLILAAQEKKKEKKEDLSGKKAASAKDDAGVFGKKDKPKEDKAASKKGAPIVDKDKREEDRKMAQDALAALGLKGPEGAVSNVFGPGGLGSGVNNALGGLSGASMGDAGGAGGLGSRGTGAGGGGTGLGIGGLGSGTGRGSGGNGNIDLDGRGKGTTKIVPGKVIYEGGLSREEIQRVIARVMSQIKYCYEKELNKDPNLEGKLVMFWLISGSGDVQTASASQNTFSGSSAKPIEQCVQRIIQRLKFPTPKGGGVVNVTYPFVFSNSGG
jgi:outer membrane biosynthesis protein TonB